MKEPTHFRPKDKVVQIEEKDKVAQIEEAFSCFLIWPSLSAAQQCCAEASFKTKHRPSHLIILLTITTEQFKMGWSEEFIIFAKRFHFKFKFNIRTC